MPLKFTSKKQAIAFYTCPECQASVEDLHYYDEMREIDISRPIIIFNGCIDLGSIEDGPQIPPRNKTTNWSYVKCTKCGYEWGHETFNVSLSIAQAKKVFHLVRDLLEYQDIAAHLSSQLQHAKEK